MKIKVVRKQENQSVSARSMIKKRTYLIVLVIVFIISVHSRQALCSPDLSNEAWYKNTVEYIDRFERFIQDSFDQPKRTNLYDYQPVQEAKEKLLNTAAPSEEELLILLDSIRALDNKVAMVNVNLRNTYSKELFNAMLGNFNTKEQFFLNYYFYYALRGLNQEQLKQHDDAILKTIKWEFDKNQLLIAMPALVKMKDQKVIPLFLIFFKSSDSGFKKLVYYHLMMENKELLKSIKELLIREKETDAIDFIKKLEKDGPSNK